MGKISRTWSLMGGSWEVLKKDKEILLFSLFSGICCLVVVASFAIPMFSGGYLQDRTGKWAFPPPPLTDQATTNQQIFFYTFLFMFYFCNYFVIVFFNSAITACATIRMSGGDPTLSDGFRAAFRRLHLIVGWTLVSATVGLVLRILEDRSEKVGKFVAGLLGTAWTIASFLVIPILVIDEKGPITALRESTILLKKTWGELLIGNFSFGLLQFLLSILAVFPLVLGVLVGGITALIICIALAVVYLIALTLVLSTLQTIFRAAVYSYARSGQAPTGFHPEELRDSMTAK